MISQILNGIFQICVLFIPKSQVRLVSHSFHQHVGRHSKLICRQMRPLLHWPTQLQPHFISRWDITATWLWQ